MVSLIVVAKHNKIGEIGEEIACNWLINHGYSVIERNYLKKYGEIDIVARETTGKVHFIEVKTVSHETKAKLDYAVTHGTWRPEEMVHFHKQTRFKRVIETWLAENDPEYQLEWQIDILTVRIVEKDKYAAVKLLDDVIFE